MPALVVMIVDGAMVVDRVVPAAAFAEDKADEDEGTRLTPGRGTNSPPGVEEVIEVLKTVPGVDVMTDLIG